MLIKYDFNNNLEEIDQPSIVKINKTLVSITHASGTDSTEIPDDGELVILIGDTETFNPTPITPEPVPPTPTPTPSEGGDEPSGGGDTPSGGGDTPSGGDIPGGDTPTPSGNDIGFVLVNECRLKVRLSGRITLNISQTSTNWDISTQVPANINGPTNGASWSKNTVEIPIGGSYSWTASIDSNYTNGNYYFMSTDRPQISVYSIYLYTRTYRRSQQKTEGSTGIYRVAPLQNTKLERGKTYTLRITSMYEDATLDPNDTTKGYVILPIGEESL